MKSIQRKQGRRVSVASKGFGGTGLLRHRIDWNITNQMLWLLTRELNTGLEFSVPLDKNMLKKEEKVLQVSAVIGTAIILRKVLSG